MKLTPVSDDVLGPSHRSIDKHQMQSASMWLVIANQGPPAITFTAASLGDQRAFDQMLSYANVSTNAAEAA